MLLTVPIFGDILLSNQLFYAFSPKVCFISLYHHEFNLLSFLVNIYS